MWGFVHTAQSVEGLLKDLKVAGFLPHPFRATFRISGKLRLVYLIQLLFSAFIFIETSEKILKKE